MIDHCKLQFQMGKDTYSISKVGEKVTFWVLAPNKKLKRNVASKVTDEAQIKKLQRIYAKVEKAVEG